MTAAVPPQVFPVSLVEHPFKYPVKDPATGRTAVGVPLAAVPDGWTLESLQPFFDEYRHRPDRRRGVVRVKWRSIIAYLDRYRNKETTVAFIQRVLPGLYRLQVVFNYHPASPDDTETGFGDFQAVTYVFRRAALDALLGQAALPQIWGTP